MDRFERKLINGYLSCRKATIAELTKKKDIVELIQKLRPVKTPYEMIRIGPSGDGGYLVPNDLSGVVSCFSPGVGEEFGFEKDCLAKGMRVFMADASVDESLGFPDECQFRQQYIGAYSHGEYISMDEWIEDDLSGPDGDSCRWILKVRNTRCFLVCRMLC